MKMSAAKNLTENGTQNVHTKEKLFPQTKQTLSLSLSLSSSFSIYFFIFVLSYHHVGKIFNKKASRGFLSIDFLFVDLCGFLVLKYSSKIVILG